MTNRTFVVSGFLFLVLGLSSFTLNLFYSPTLFAQSGDAPSANQPSQTVDVCHVPPGQPEQAKKLTLPESAAQAHLDHGDTYGGCFVKLREIKTDAEIQSFEINNQGRMSVLITERDVRFYAENELSKSISRERYSEVLTDRSPQSKVMLRKVEERNQEGPTLTSYRIYDSTGNLINEGEMNFPGNLDTFFGNKILIRRAPTTYNGSLSLQRLDGSGLNSIWKMDGVFSYELSFASDPEKFLSMEYNRQLIPEYSLRDLATGRKVSSSYKLDKKYSPIDQWSSISYKYSYVTVRNRRNGKSEVFVFDENFNLISHFDDLGRDVTGGWFFEEQGILYMGGSSDLLRFEVDSNSKKKIQLPNNFKVRRVIGDSSQNIVILSGVEKNPTQSRKRRIIIFDSGQEKFVKDLTYKPNQLGYKYSSWQNPNVFVVKNKQKIVIGHPKTVTVYRYDF